MFLSDSTMRSVVVRVFGAPKDYSFAKLIGVTCALLLVSCIPFVIYTATLVWEHKITTKYENDPTYYSQYEDDLDS